MVMLHLNTGPSGGVGATADLLQQQQQQMVAAQKLQMKQQEDLLRKQQKHILGQQQQQQVHLFPLHHVWYHLPVVPDLNDVNLAQWDTFFME